MSDSTTIGILSIGSGVGQSVVNSCRISLLPFYLIGLGTNPLAYGMYECHEYAIIPTFYSESYIQDLLNISTKLGIQILIPGHDDEAHLISKHIDLFEENGVKVLTAGKQLHSLCRDKERMSRELNNIANVFVRSFDCESFVAALNRKEVELPVIAKPRAGYASKGIEIINTTEDLNKLKPSHIIQELAVPHDADPNYSFYINQLGQGVNPQVSEISIQLVARKDGTLMGRMASFNKLNNGVPIEILPYENREIWKAVDRLYPEFVRLGLRGPLNLQGRFTNHGLKIFEMNARFTGITGLRALMGFNEVEACIKNWIYGDNPLLKINQRKVGIRQTADKTIDLDCNTEVRDRVITLNSRLLKAEKSFLVTGSTGSLGRRLAQMLATTEGYEVITLDRNKEKAKNLHQNKLMQHYDWEDLSAGVFSLGNVDCLIHLASARPHHTPEEIADSLRTSCKLFACAVKGGVHEIVNISSQSVYGQSHPAPWDENTSPAPQSIYAQAKYAIEAHLEQLGYLYPGLRHVSIRLGAVTGPDPEISSIEAVAKLTLKAVKNEPIVIKGGHQIINRMDVRDAASGIFKIIELDPKCWERLFNLGSDEQNSLADIVTMIKRVVEQGNRGNVTLEFTEEDATGSICLLNSEKLKQTTGWQCVFSLKDTIQDMVANFECVDQSLST